MHSDDYHRQRTVIVAICWTQSHFMTSPTFLTQRQAPYFEIENELNLQEQEQRARLHQLEEHYQALDNMSTRSSSRTTPFTEHQNLPYESPSPTKSEHSAIPTSFTPSQPTPTSKHTLSRNKSKVDAVVGDGEHHLQCTTKKCVAGGGLGGKEIHYS